ncbi:Cactin [Tetrabaena socialis]|uniref:Splicing factor Cactin n=1 Tax=Tetrabaena socialis TaxID=47790 RepID=A0A2J8AFF6_9CHLO|nr:Cactin [Tetrabaena socialis]|eukprot:PNH11255.1 Cactin [Tetrabaena socialis]
MVMVRGLQGENGGDAADRAALRRGGEAGPGGAGGGGGGGGAPEDGAARGSLHSDVEVQIENMLSGQTHGSLVGMEADVERALQGGLGDPEYWEAVLKRLQVHKAKAQVRELQAAVMQRHIAAEIIKREAAREERRLAAEERRKQAQAEGRDPAELDLEDSSSSSGSESGGEEERAGADKGGGEGGAGEAAERRAAGEQPGGSGDAGGYVPFRGAGQFRSPEEEESAALTAFRVQAERTMGQNAATTTTTTTSVSAPVYRIAPDPASTDNSTCFIIFSAGPPYEDIAFRVVNKEWEYSHKRGFKCTYDRGILHVYFNFKRTRYRR